MKKVYNSPKMNVILVEVKHICNVSGTNVSIDSTHTVDAGNSLSRDGGNFWDDDED